MNSSGILNYMSEKSHNSLYKNGKVFNKDENLSQIMIAEAKKSVQRIYYSSLLPKNFSRNL